MKDYRRNVRAIQWPIVAGLFFLIVGSQAEAAKVGSVEKKYQTDLPKKLSEIGAGPPLINSAPHLLVRIEYPAAITNDGTAALVAEAKAVGGEMARGVSDEVMRARAIDGVNKSAYYAMRLYKALRSTGDFPEGTIALAPRTVTRPRDYGDKIGLNPEAAAVPAVLTVRYAVYRNLAIDVTEDKGGSYALALKNSFAEFVTPRVAVLTEQAAWPQTGGIIASLNLPGTPYFSCRPDKCLSRSPTVADFLLMGLNFMVGPVPNFDLRKVSKSFPPDRQAGVADAVMTCPETVAGAIAACPFEAGLVGVIRQALRQVDPYLATRFQWKQYIGNYDPLLAVRFPAAVDDVKSATRIAVLKTIMAAERRFDTQRSDRLIVDGLAGLQGTAIRNQRRAEQSYSASARKASSGFSLASVLGSATNMMQFGQAFSAKDTMSQLAIIQAEGQRAAQSNEAGRQAVAQMSSMFSSQMNGNIEDLGSTTLLGQSLSAGTLDGLRAKLIKIYRSRKFPAIPDAQKPCATFVQKGVVTTGYGDCRVVGIGNDANLEGNAGFVQIGPAYEWVGEVRKKLSVFGGSWTTTGGKLSNLGMTALVDRLLTAKDVASQSISCSMITIDGRSPETRSVAKCLDQPPKYLSESGFGAVASKEDAENLSSQYDDWLKSRHSLIESASK